MNCEAAQSLLPAFADGRSAGDDLRLLETHVAGCAACRARVEELRSLRSALQRDLRTITAPAVLRDRIRAITGRSRTSPEGGDFSPGRSPPSVSAGRYWRLPRLVAAAACLALAAVAVWHWGVPREPVPTAPGARLAVMAAAKHMRCCALCEAHHKQGLPRECAQVAVAIDQHFQNTIHALAPNLSSHGYDFESANYCGIRGSGCTFGGHVVYLRGGDVPMRFSVFSVHREYVPDAPEVDRCQRTLGGGKIEPGFLDAQVEGRGVCVAMWHRDSTYYFCCGEMPGEQMSPLVADVQLTLENLRVREMFAALADGRIGRP